MAENTSSVVGGLAAPSLRLTSKRKAERVFYLGYTLLIWLVAIVSFTPSFYLRGVIPVPTPLAPLRIDIILHGVAATVFMSAFPIQAWLMATGRKALHMTIGKPLFLFAVVFALSGYVANAMTYRDVPRIAVDTAFLAAVTLMTIVSFALMAGLAWRRRFDGQAHKRLIVCAGVLMLGPGLARVVVMTQSSLGPALVGVITWTMLVPLWLWDLATRRRPHWATVTGTAVFFVGNVLVGLMASFPMRPFVQLLPLYGWP